MTSYDLVFGVMQMRLVKCVSAAAILQQLYLVAENYSDKITLCQNDYLIRTQLMHCNYIFSAACILEMLHQKEDIPLKCTVTKHKNLLTLPFTVIMAFTISLCRNVLKQKLNYFMGAVFMHLKNTCFMSFHILKTHLPAHFKAVWQEH